MSQGRAGPAGWQGAERTAVGPPFSKAQLAAMIKVNQAASCYACASVSPQAPRCLRSDGSYSGLVAVALTIPAAVAVAVLRYRLYDIDRVISRAVAYAIVTGLVIGIYAGLTLLATQVLRLRTPVAVAGATLAAAALFSPIRRRVQQIVDRRFNRARYDADQTAAVFAARLKDAVDLDSVRDDLAEAVDQALKPAHVSVWISPQR
jgi:hypothetical protein